MCPHTAALGALVGGKPALPTQAIKQAVAAVGSPVQNAPPTGIRTPVHFSDQHHPFAVRSRDITQLRI
jgi:hypothetical protein